MFAGASPIARLCLRPVRSSLHNVGGWTARWAAIAPEREAIIDGARRLSYRELDERVARAAGWLADRGVARGERVALLLANGSAYLELVLAAARIGALSVPLNSRLSPGELAFQLADCRPALAVRDAEFATTFDAANSRNHPTGLRGFDVERDFEHELLTAPPRPVEPVAPDDPMMLLYTSGTTGSAKGALLPHRKTLFNALNAQLYFGIRGGEDRVLVAAPLFHSLGLKILSLPALYAGATLVIHRRFDAAAFWREVEREHITYSGGVPTHYGRLLEELNGSSREFDRSHLRFLFTAGAAVAPETVRAYRGHGLVLKQGFGQTESSILCCLHEDEAVRHAGSVGRPVFHAELRIVNPATFDQTPERWAEVAPGDVGEIVVRGPITMLGYWERPEETAAALRDGWLRTGDLAHRDAEGFITLTGRARDMIISGGENVYPAEVEAILVDHPAIREIAITGIPDEHWGEVGCAWVVLQPGQTLDLEDLHEWAAERLARFKLPRELVVVDALPRTASGKVQKHALESA